MTEPDLTMFFGTTARGIPKIPSELLEPALMRLIGAWGNGWLRGEQMFGEDWMPLDKLIERLKAMSALCSEVRAMHAYFICNNWVGRLERQRRKETSDV